MQWNSGGCLKLTRPEGTDLRLHLDGVEGAILFSSMAEVCISPWLLCTYSNSELKPATPALNIKIIDRAFSPFDDQNKKKYCERNPIEKKKGRPK